MKTSILAVSAAALSLSPSADALTAQRRDASPRVVHMDMQRTQTDATTRQQIRERLAKRAGTVTAALNNIEGGSFYTINATIGTPAQNLAFSIDTGSSDLWANTNSSFCTTGGGSRAGASGSGSLPCSFAGLYNANSSSTNKYVNSLFNITYGDGTGAIGDYVTDTVTIGGTTIPAQQFGIGYRSSSTQGVMGIGYPGLEAINQRSRSGTYDNIPQSLAKQGAIPVPAYSLWLNDLQSSQGSILFGGIDTSKFSGSLTALPIVKENNQYLELIVNLQGLSVTANGKSTNTAIQSNTPVLLDSGTTLAYLDVNTCNTIYSAVGARFSSADQIAIVPCNLAQNTGDFLTFNFGSTTISVSMAELVLGGGSSTSQGGGTGSTSNSGGECIFAIAPQQSAGSGTVYVLGDAFLRSVYAVYDLDANTISLAQTNFNGGSSNVQEITAGAQPTATGTGSPNSAAPEGWRTAAVRSMWIAAVVASAVSGWMMS